MDDPCDAIQTFGALRKWADRGQRYGEGELFCMWTGTVPAIALPGEQWRAENWITERQRSLRAIGRFEMETQQ